MRGILLAALGAALMSATGCTAAMNLLAGEPLSNSEGTQIVQVPGIDGQFEWSGTQASVQGRTTIVARTQEQWENLWQLTGTPAPGPLPRDWMGIGVFLGMRQTAGYGVVIETITEQVTTDRQFIEQGLPSGRELVVSYGERAPPPGAMAAQVLTSPFVIRIVRRDDSQVRFVQAR